MSVVAWKCVGEGYVVGCPYLRSFGSYQGPELENGEGTLFELTGSEIGEGGRLKNIRGLDNIRLFFLDFEV
jgi:hypothetical protein